MYNHYFQRLPRLRSARSASKTAGLNRQVRPHLLVVYGSEKLPYTRRRTTLPVRMLLVTCHTCLLPRCVGSEGPRTL
jgi:hypothetical protein